MFTLKKLLNALGSILQRGETKREIDDELKFHLEMLIEENIGSGMSAEQARQSAFNRFGNLTDVNAVCLEIKTRETILWLEDVRGALQRIFTKPWFTLISVLTLSFAIGAAIAVFNLVNHVLWQPIFAKNSDKIVVIQEINSFGIEVDTSNLNFLDLRSQNSTLEHIAAYSFGTRSIIAFEESIRSNVSWISEDFFAVLAVEPILGRHLNSADHQIDSTPAVVVSYRFWQKQLNFAQNLEDRKINVDGRDYSIVGVLPPEINLSTETDVWIPRGLFVDDTARSAHNLKVIGRIKEKFTLSQVQEDLDSIQGRLIRDFPDSNAGQILQAVPLQQHLTADIRPMLMTLLIGVGFLLFIACANVINLILIRDEPQQLHTASRIKLGMSRSRVFRMVMIECLLLSIISTLFGILLSASAGELIFNLISGNFLKVSEIKFNEIIVIFACGISLIIGILCGLLPALKLSHADLTDSFVEKEMSHDKKSFGLGSLLIVSELALTAILVFSAISLIQNFWQLSNTDSGFNPNDVLTIRLSLPSANYVEEQDKINFYRQILGKVKSIPSIEFAGLINNLPLTGENINGTFYFEENPTQTNHAGFRISSSEYFQSLSIPLIEGRFFTEEDNENSMPVAIISENLARKIFPTGKPIGQRIRFPGMDSNDEVWMTVIGVVGQIRHHSLESVPEPEIYVPYLQRPFKTNDMTVTVKFWHNADTLTADMQNTIKSIDPNLPIRFEMMHQILSNSLSRHLQQTVFLSFFALFALILSLTGFFILIRYEITSRMKNRNNNEIIGKQDLVAHSVKKGFALTLIAVGLGFVGIIVITHYLPNMLVGSKNLQTIIFAATSLIMFSVTFMISYLTSIWTKN